MKAFAALAFLGLALLPTYDCNSRTVQCVGRHRGELRDELIPTHNEQAGGNINLAIPPFPKGILGDPWRKPNNKGKKYLLVEIQ